MIEKVKNILYEIGEYILVIACWEVVKYVFKIR